MPDDDILPFRTQYRTNEDGSLYVNIGINRVISACPAWYTFADVIKSKLLTGRTPKILKTIELFPIGKQRTKVIQLFGEDRNTVDLAQGDDLFATLIDARIDVQNELDDELTPEDRKAFLDRFQNGLKLTANGTSYGTLVEFIADDHLEEVPTTVYIGVSSAAVKGEDTQSARTAISRFPIIRLRRRASFLLLLVLSFPPGRLLLGIAERLATDRGLTYAFCDTDSRLSVTITRDTREKSFGVRSKKYETGFSP